MPIQDGKYVSPDWSNSSPPPINASELNALSETVEKADANYTRDETLSDEVKTLLGLDSSATPNEVFSRVTLNKAQYGINLYVKYQDGTPVSGVTVTSSGQPLSGGSMVTDEQGHIYLVQDNTSFTASIDNADGKVYFDLAKNPSVSITLTKLIQDVNLTWNYDTSMIKITSSITKNISPKAKTVDVCCVGGGQGGEEGGYSGSGGVGGDGGDGGNITNVMAYTIPSGTRTLKTGIGSGGSINGGNGGNTYFKINDIEVCRGAGGGSVTPGNGGTGGAGGVSSGDNVAGKSGGAPTGYIFNDSSNEKVSGGGGGGAGTWSYRDADGTSGGVGSTKGGHGDLTVTAGSAPGGGGGGGWGGGWSWDKSGQSNGLAGGAGAVYLRFHH